ncbi:hypothetical protein ACU5JM_30080 [Rhodococcus erythropolis]|uniref:hypothetical protein n=1 Tax=Rhodococcus erythropolis TaxID=1833 RepID=UPI00406BA72A
MNPSRFFEVLRDRWIVVGISTVLGLLVGVLLTMLTPTTFKSSTELFLTTPGWGTPTTLGNADSSPFQGDEFSQQRAGTYTRLAEGADFSARVASRLGESGLRDVESLSVRVVPDTVLLEISGTADSADRALQLTNAASDEMNETIRRLETPSGTLIPTVQPLTVVTASAPTSPSGPQTIPNLLLGLVVGSMVGVTGVILAAARSRAVQGVDELAAWTGLPVLESIPYLGDRGLSAEEGAQSASRSSFERLQFKRDLIGSGTPASPVLVTAADEGEISRFAAGGIADAACALGYSVVLVDCNFRSSRAHIELGVTDIVMSDSVLDDVLISTPLQPTLLRSGSPTETPERVFESESFGRMLRDLSARFDVVVVFDSGGTQYADSSRLAKVCRSIILVVQSHSMNRQDLMTKIHDLEIAGAKIEGSVLLTTTRRGQRGAVLPGGRPETTDSVASHTPRRDGDTRTQRSPRKANT